MCAEALDRRKVHLLGFDLDEILIQRAQQTNPLPGSISFIPLDIIKDTDQLQDYLHQHGCSRFHLCLCLAVTMWVHLNHGDSGLLQLLSSLASISEHLLLEAQPWKCYRSAARRLRKLGRSDFDHFKTLKICGDIAEHAREHLEGQCGMELIRSFGSTAWDRKLLLFKRKSNWDQRQEFHLLQGRVWEETARETSEEKKGKITVFFTFHTNVATICFSNVKICLQ